MNKSIEHSIKEQKQRKLLQVRINPDLIDSFKEAAIRLKTTQVKLLEAILIEALKSK